MLRSVAGDPFEYLKGSTVQIVPFRGVDSDIHQLYTINNNTKWVQTDVSVKVGAPVGASDPIGYVSGIRSNLLLTLGLQPLNRVTVSPLGDALPESERGPMERFRSRAISRRN
jgi:hypothetical protein